MKDTTRTLLFGFLLCACSGTTKNEQDAPVSEDATPTPSGSASGQLLPPNGVPATGADPDAQVNTDVDPPPGAMSGNERPPSSGPPTTDMPPAPTPDPDSMSGPDVDLPNTEPPDTEPSNSEPPNTEPPDTEPGLDVPPDDEPDAGTDGAAGGGPAQTTADCKDGPLELPTDGCAPEFEETGDFYADCVARINQLRWECQCLPPLERWTEAESCADAQAEYDYEENRPHAGINDRICEPGGGSQNECPDYGPRFGIVDFCLQQMWDEGPGDDFQAHGHYINMSDTGVTKVACGRFETPEGNIWSVQNFSR